MGQRQSQSKTQKKIPNDIKKISRKLKYMGMVCGYSGAIQGTVYVGLTICALFFFFHYSDGPIASAFKEIYFDLAVQKTTMACLVSPHSLLFLLVVYFGLSLAYFVISVWVIVTYTKWQAKDEVKTSGKIWVIFTGVQSVIDVFAFCFFLTDIYCISMSRLEPGFLSSEDRHPTKQTYIPPKKSMEDQYDYELLEMNPVLPEAEPEIIPFPLFKPKMTELNAVNSSQVEKKQPSKREQEVLPLPDPVPVTHKVKTNTTNKTTTARTITIEERYDFKMNVEIMPEERKRYNKKKGQVPLFYASATIMTFLLRGYAIWGLNLILLVLLGLSLKGTENAKSFLTFHLLKEKIYYHPS